jgi:serine/threonine protein kinase
VFSPYGGLEDDVWASRSRRGRAWVATRSSPSSTRGGWAKCTGRTTPSSVAPWRSRLSRPPSRIAPIACGRFELEARAAAALNHPNILAVYDVGRHEGTPFIVSELLEGQTLRARMEGAAPPLRTALEFGIQIAEGLAAAHDKGIVHRDLKPENVFVTRDERVKILDFGLAKLRDDEAGTLTAAPQTAAGAVLGTVGYLSPEQASGLPADQRSDIFSLGAILFELVTYRRAFARPTAAQTLTAVLEDDPTASVTPGRGPSARVMHLVRRCLEKSPERRFQSARDLALVLSRELTESTFEPRRARVAIPRLSTVALMVVCLTIGAVLGRGIWSTAASRGAEPRVDLHGADRSTSVRIVQRDASRTGDGPDA